MVERLVLLLHQTTGESRTLFEQLEIAFTPQISDGKAKKIIKKNI